MNVDAFPNAPGTYVLWLRIATSLMLQVGRLGTFEWSPGFYAYVGSAHGPGGLRARLRRHLRTEKTRHWHIDALTTTVPVNGLWFVESLERLECRWVAQFAAQEGVIMPVAGFGASDCACDTHLFSVPAAQIRGLWEALSQPCAVARDPTFMFSA